MKRTRDESATPKTKDDGEEEVVNTGEHENDVSGRTSNPASRDEEEAELRRRLLEKVHRDRNDAANDKSGISGTSGSSEPSTADLPPAKSRKTGVEDVDDEDASRLSSAGVPSARLKATGTGGGGAAGAGEPLPDVEGVPNETLFVGNLSYRVSEAVIIKLFTPFGKVVREQFCYHHVGPRRGEPRGFCFVEYSNVDEATKAIRALHGRKLYGRPLRVRYMAVEGASRMDYSTSDSSEQRSSSSGATLSAGGKIPPPTSAAGEAGIGAGVTKLSLDKKVALLKLKLREATEKST